MANPRQMSDLEMVERVLQLLQERAAVNILTSQPSDPSSLPQAAGPRPSQGHHGPLGLYQTSRLAPVPESALQEAVSANDSTNDPPQNFENQAVERSSHASGSRNTPYDAPTPAAFPPGPESQIPRPSSHATATSSWPDSYHFLPSLSPPPRPSQVPTPESMSSSSSSLLSPPPESHQSEEASLEVPENAKGKGKARRKASVKDPPPSIQSGRFEVSFLPELADKLKKDPLLHSLGLDDLAILQEATHQGALAAKKYLERHLKFLGEPTLRYGTARDAADERANIDEEDDDYSDYANDDLNKTTSKAPITKAEENKKYNALTSEGKTRCKALKTVLIELGKAWAHSAILHHELKDRYDQLYYRMQSEFGLPARARFRLQRYMWEEHWLPLVEKRHEERPTPRRRRILEERAARAGNEAGEGGGAV